MVIERGTGGSVTEASAEVLATQLSHWFEAAPESEGFYLRVPGHEYPFLIVNARKGFACVRWFPEAAHLGFQSRRT